MGRLAVLIGDIDARHLLHQPDFASALDIRPRS
jgi:hypothetical protein